MRVPPIIVDVILGSFVGAFGYAGTAGLLPRLRGPMALAVCLVAGVLLVALRNPDGSLRQWAHEASGGVVPPPGTFSRWSLHSILTADIASRPIPQLLIKVAIAWLVAIVALGVLTPLTEFSGRTVPAWIPWAVLVASLTLFVGPYFWNRPKNSR